jgi:hypothetical protein
LKIIIAACALILLSNNLFSNDIDYENLSIIVNNIELDFSKFPSKNIWNRGECIQNLDTQIKRNYETIITNASKQEPNFNGKYKIVEFGYGSGVQYFFVIDLNSGNVYEGISSTHGIKYRQDSSLIIINDPEIVLLNWKDFDGNIPNWITIEYLLWEGEQWKKILIINP